MLNMLKDPAKRAEWVYGQPMAPCPKCGSYNMKPQIPIALDVAGDDTTAQLVGKWARATKAGATPLQGPAYYACWDCGHKGPAVNCTGRTSEGLGSNAQTVGRWYCVSREGKATLCVDEEDAQKNAKHRDQAWLAGGPYRAVQLVDAAPDHWRDRARKAEGQIVRLTEWMVEQGLLHYHDHCKRPDGSSGPAWVVRKPATVWGDACEAWHATSAAGAVDTWLLGPSVGGNAT